MAMDELHAPKSETLRNMYWRSEILQVMYWLRGEGLGDLIDAPMVERFLGVDADIVVTYLGRLVTEGYLHRDGEWFSLSELGRKEGAVEFATAFSGLTRPAHGECSDDCWCHSSAEEADACAQQRAAAHQHEHQH